MKSISAALLLLALVALVGCQNQRPGNLLAAVLIPNHPPKTVGVQCLVSSSGTCYFAFYGLSTGDTTVSIATGARTLVSGITRDTLYCAESQKSFLHHCTELLVPREQAMIQRNIHSQQPLRLLQ